ncbi:hypothetical protein CEXT_750221 [Caerostris extrusa]|uniref:Uncharacterized protein n=1 Tax=Caerostris extrusa TaxID=172846 RepID=A0AAV4NV40_CAEEX|nr:hypothetical protein CEXT_750221 [Caerostris extrusa]
MTFSSGAYTDRQLRIRQDEFKALKALEARISSRTRFRNGFTEHRFDFQQLASQLTPGSFPGGAPVRRLSGQVGDVQRHHPLASIVTSRCIIISWVVFVALSHFYGYLLVSHIFFLLLLQFRSACSFRFSLSLSLVLFDSLHHSVFLPFILLFCSTIIRASCSKAFPNPDSTTSSSLLKH